MRVFRLLWIIWVVAWFRLFAESLAPPASCTIGAQFPLYNMQGKEDGGGRRRLAAFLMAIKHINNKKDGFHDKLLPNTTLQVSIYDSKRDSGIAAINAVRIVDDKADIAVGPASSAPTITSQNIFKLKSINIPQIAYSATSPELSNSQIYPLFVRTPPSDTYQARMIAATIKARGFRFVCVISGSDAYSSAGASEFVSIVNKKDSGLKLLRQVEFYTGVESVLSEMNDLKDASCRIIVMWATESDIRTIAKDADIAGVTASNKDAPVLWFSSELFLSSYENSCNIPGLCEKVFHGALLLTPSFGPGNPGSYARLADAWHKQVPRIGQVSRHDVAGCDTSRDFKNASIWIRKVSSKVRCVAVNFSDYDRKAASKYEVESTGDGCISNYVPYAYDSALAVAHGLHDLFTSKKWMSAKKSEEGKLFTGAAIYDAIINVQAFDGFSGKVRFHRHKNSKNGGDRDAGELTFYVYNYNGVNFRHVGSIYRNNLNLSMPLTNPRNFGTGEDFDDRPYCRKPQQYRFQLVSDCDPSMGKIPLNITHDAKECNGEPNKINYDEFCRYTPLSSSMGTCVLLFCVVGGMLQLGWLLWLLRMRAVGSKTIKYSQFEFLFIFNVGLMLTALSPIQFMGTPTETTCVTRVWHLNLGITLTWAPMLVKIFRVYKLFETRKLKKRTDLKVKRMLRMVGYLVLFEIFILLPHSLIPGIKPVPAVVNASQIFTGDQYNFVSGEIRLASCTSGYDAEWSTLWQAGQSSVHIIALSLIALLAYRVRKAPKEFQESKYMGLIGMNVVSICIVAGAIFFGMRDSLQPQFILFIQAMTTFMITTLAVLLMYLPKLRNIRQGDAEIQLGQLTASITRKPVKKKTNKTVINSFDKNLGQNITHVQNPLGNQSNGKCNRNSWIQ